jgi:hypothetical protein
MLSCVALYVMLCSFLNVADAMLTRRADKASSVVTGQAVRVYSEDIYSLRKGDPVPSSLGSGETSLLTS